MSSLFISQNPSCPQEDPLRALPSFLNLLEVEALDHHSQDRALCTLQRGLIKLLDNNPNAVGLHRFVKDVDATLAWTRDKQPHARTGVRTPTAQAALTQPTASLPLTAHHILLSCWGLVAYACWTKKISIPVGAD